ncbi:DUF3617 family protein [Variovorax paradoxus]|nr:DUF3617 family protein [Variovorax paradoxus]
MRIHAPRPAIAAAACFLLASAASALDYPPRKPGLWEMSIQADDGASKTPAMQTQQCIDAATDKALRDMGSSTGQQACSKQDMRTEGGRIVVDSVCKIGATTVTTHSVVSGDMGNGYRMESRSSYNPPLAGRKEGTAVIEAKWVGPCKAGQKPGDMMMPNGMKMNVLDMMGGKKK